MVGKSRPKTKNDQRRLDAIKSIGCVPCRQMGYFDIPCDIQHCLSGGKRRGHQYTYGACPYHHRGVDEHGLGLDVLYRILGPSLALNNREYKETFGDDDYLIAEQDRLIEIWEDSII